MILDLCNTVDIEIRAENFYRRKKTFLVGIATSSCLSAELSHDLTLRSLTVPSLQEVQKTLRTFIVDRS